VDLLFFIKLSISIGCLNRETQEFRLSLMLRDTLFFGVCLLIEEFIVFGFFTNFFTCFLCFYGMLVVNLLIFEMRYEDFLSDVLAV
jgi:hypothetical protein